jgi:hypothetical protein
MAKRTPRKMPTRLYKVGVPVRFLLEKLVKATSRTGAMEKARAAAAKRSNRRLRPFVKRVA